jgi:hypothetical protein
MAAYVRQKHPKPSVSVQVGTEEPVVLEIDSTEYQSYGLSLKQDYSASRKK